MQYRRLRGLTLTALITASLAAAGTASASNTSPVGQNAYKASVDARQLKALRGAGFDVTEMTVNAAGRTTVPLIGTDRQIRALRKFGIRAHLVKRYSGKSLASGYTVYRTYSEPGGIADEMRALARDYPRITKLEEIGRSIQGKPILALKVTLDARRLRDGSKPSVLYVSTQHAREWIATETGRRMMHYMVERYDSNATVHRLVRDRELWFIPVANPDGYDFTFTPGHRLWRKNLRDNNGDGKIEAGVDGVDPNRNFPTNWNLDDEGSSSLPGSETYRGTGPASEPETRALDGLLRRVGFKALINYHSAAELLLYPFGFQVDTKSDDDPIFESLTGTDGPDPTITTDDHPAVPGYDPDLSAELYTTNGETTDHAYTRYGTLAWTPELDTAQSAGVPNVSVFEFPDDEAKIEAVFEKNIPFALNVATSANDLSNPRASTQNTAANYQVPATPDFVVDSFSESYGSSQDVQANVKRELGPIVMFYRVNGGYVRTATTHDWRGGERYGSVRGTYFHKVRGTVTDTHRGDSVEVWFHSLFGRQGSAPFTYRTVYDGRARVLVMAAEDYSGASPVIAQQSPKYAAANQAALTANGISNVLYDVDAHGRTAPDPLGVLSHFDAVVWYTGDDVVPRDAGGQPGTAAKLADDEQNALRDYLNEGGRLLASGRNLGFAQFGAYPYSPGPTAPVPLTDDFFQYYLGAYQYTSGLFDPTLDGLAVSSVSSPFGLNPFTPVSSPLGANSQFLTTSSFLDPAVYPDFRSKASLKYVRTGPPREAPIEGQKQAFAAHADASWERLTRQLEVPAGSPTLDLQATWKIEQDFDFAFVEVHTIGQDDWTTLVDKNGNTGQTLESCKIGWNTLHPFVDHYQTPDLSNPDDPQCLPSGTSGDWNALTGDSNGWTPLSFDLSHFAGKTVEISITYATDFASGGTGVQVDDLKLVNGATSTPITGFENGLDGFTVAGPPPGSAPNGADWVIAGTLKFPGDEAAGVVTHDTITLGFGLEQLDTPTRTRLVGQAMRYLLR